MKRYSSIAVIELSSIARGLMTGDIMLKHAPVSLVRSGSVHNGKYLILIGGSVASVEEAYKKGKIAGGHLITDSIFLPDVHGTVFDALFGQRKKCSGESLVTVETLTVPSAVKVADSGIKGADVNIVEIRMADDLGGKGIVIFTGKLEEVETVAKIGEDILSESGSLLNVSIIPRPLKETTGQINTATSFSDVETVLIKDGEI